MGDYASFGHTVLVSQWLELFPGTVRKLNRSEAVLEDVLGFDSERGPDSEVVVVKSKLADID